MESTHMENPFHSKKLWWSGQVTSLSTLIQLSVCDELSTNNDTCTVICSLQQHLVTCCCYITHYGKSRVQNKPGWKEKKVDSQDGESKQIQWKWGEAALSREQAVGTLFPEHPHLLHSIRTFSQIFCWVKLRETQMLAGDNTIITASSWAVLQYIKLGLTSPFLPHCLTPKNHTSYF